VESATKSLITKGSLCHSQGNFSIFSGN